MTALPHAAGRDLGLRLGRPILLAAGLGGLVVARWAATVHGGVLESAGTGAGALAVGVAFGAGLVVLALAGGYRPARPRLAGRVTRIAESTALGILGAAALVGLALLGSAGVGPALGPGAWFTGGFAPWAAVTLLVATAEELGLRGALFDASTDAWGGTTAVIVTSIAFALIHVPLYGLQVVPLDLGVGLLLGGLRLISGGVAAPAAAHALADLATWWL
jgi:membrane protease YdiL (CAAX protease family)